MRSWLRMLEEFALSVLSPPECVACGEAIPMTHIFCSVCARTLEPAPRGTAGLRTPHAYGGALATAIGRLKYEGATHLARPLAHLLIPPRVLLPPMSILVPVPLSRRRLVERGYNQSALLARELSARASLSVDYSLLDRVRDTQPQVRLSADERRDNVRGAFALGHAVPKDRPLVILDDVATTLSTLEACRQVLLCAGAAEVTCVTLARASLTGDG